MRRIRAQSYFPAAATAAWVALALLVCLSMLSPITAFALPSKATPRKLSISTPYLVYVTPTIPTETEPREAWFERVSLAGISQTCKSPYSLPLTFHTRQVQQCAQAGVPMVQIRDKVLPSEVREAGRGSSSGITHPPACSISHPFIHPTPGPGLPCDTMPTAPR